VVGSGPNGANPHHEAGNRTIERGDMIVLVGEPTDEEQIVS
jgi:Xaa-Pro aminopeptidase